jgi:hypothetical protein
VENKSGEVVLNGPNDNREDLEDYIGVNENQEELE